MGLCIPVLLLPVYFARKHPDRTFTPRGDFSATCDYSHIINDTTCNVLDAALFSSEEYMPASSDFIFGVLNIADTDTKVLLPENGPCLAYELYPEKPLDGWKISADFKLAKLGEHHFTFDMVYHNNVSFEIPKDELSRHGMTLCTMYL